MVVENLKKLFAVFVIMLFIFIPVYVSSVYASLNLDYAYGSAENNGWVKKYDDLHVSVLTDETNPLNVKLNGIEFDSCSNGKCILVLNDMTFYPTSSNLWERTITNHDTGEEVDISLTIDGNAPISTNFNTTQQGNKIIIDYEFIDDNFQKIDFYTNNNLVKTSTEKSGTEELIVLDGTYNVKAIVYDIAGNTFEETSSVNVDLTPPKITDVSFLYNNNEVDWTNGQILRDVAVIVQYDEDIMDDSCYADVSALASSLFATAYSNYKGQVSGKFCIYSGLIFDKQDGNNKNFNFKSRDLMGNVGDESYSKTFSYDGESPVVNSFESQYVDVDGKNWIASSVGDDLDLKLNTNKIYLKFSETGGSGVSSSRVYIDLNDIYETGGDCVYKPVACGSSSCEFLVPIKNNNNLKDGVVVIPYYSTDNAGNSFEGETQLNIYVDNFPPSIDSDSIMITTTGEYDCTIGECKQGDDIIIKFNVTDDGAPGDSIEVYGDLSKVGGYEEDAFSCSKIEEHKFTCTKTINDIIGPYTDIAIPITLKDIVGNVVVDDGSVSFDVAYNEQLYSGDIPLLWIASDPGFSVMPNIGIDVGVDLPYDIYVPISFIKHSDYSSEGFELKMLQVDILEYETNEDDNIINNIQLYTNPNDISNMWLVVDIVDSQPETELNELKINVSLSIISKFKKNDVYVITDSQTINTSEIIINIYDNPMGAIGENVQKKIQSVRDSALVKSGGFIGGMKKIIDGAETLCSIYAMITTIPVMFEGIGYSIQALGNIPPLSFLKPVGTGLVSAGKWIRGSVIYPSGSFANIIEWVCAGSSCTLWDKITKDYEGKNKFLNFMQRINLNEDSEFGDAIKEGIGFSSAVTPDSNILVAIVGLCLPGVVNNLEKARQIECHYGYCMEVQVPNGEALPLQCDAMRGRQWCEYYYGSLYNFVIGTVVEQVFDGVRKISSDPIAFLLHASTLGCITIKAASLDGIYWLPTILSYIPFLGEAWAMGNNLNDLFSSPEEMIDSYSQSGVDAGIYITVGALVVATIIGRIADPTSDKNFCDALTDGVKVFEVSSMIPSIINRAHQIQETWSGDNDWCGKWDSESKFDEDGNYESEEETGGDDSEE